MTYNTLSELRSARNQALLECDYLMLPDSKVAGKYKDLLVAYRQELRDLPQLAEQNGLHTVQLPEFPSVIFDGDS
tara:strand:+ start:1357 stop:1581 length:225 start_codon:yes stop_codon:yes gene_type:complete